MIDKKNASEGGDRRGIKSDKIFSGSGAESAYDKERRETTYIPTFTYSVYPQT